MHDFSSFRTQINVSTVIATD